MFARHNLVWINDAGWEAASANAREADRAVLAWWRAQDWPAVVRRTDPGTPQGEQCLGVAAPPCQDTGRKVRVALRVHATHVVRVEPPVPLAAVIDSAPAAWQSGLAALTRETTALGLALRVYGSLAMQAITGQPYLTAASDIDLLIQPRDGRSLQETIALLTHYAAVLPLDGELLFPSGHAVSWKEWVRAGQDARGTRVLAKHADAVSLMDAVTLRQTLEPAHA
jgi:phosphoribosyl-dephospho-CoA transferase